MANYTRTHGANARAQEWDDLFEDARPDRTGSWLPLEALEDEGYVAGPQLRAIPTTRRGPLGPQELPPEEHRPTARHQTRQAQPQPVRQQQRTAAPAASITQIPARALAVLAGAALAALALYVLVSSAVEWTQVKLDDLQYGRPRTTQLDAYVGHNETGGVPSHFIAMNLNRRVTVIELPGGDGTKASAIVGPYLFGEGEDLTPVQAIAQDVNADGKPDLVVSVKNEQLIYLNDGATFKLVSPEERAAIEKQMAAQHAAANPAPGQGAGPVPAPAQGQGAAPEAGK